MRSAAARRPSRRRAFLVTLGIAWMGYGGLGIVRDPRYGTARGLAHLTDYVSLVSLGWMWVAAGAIAVVAGLVVACPRIQAAGFTALATPAALWGAAFTISWASGGYPAAVGSAFGWVGFALGVLWVSGMDDPLPPHLRKRR